MYDLTLGEIQDKGIGLLPQSLSEALSALHNDQVIQESLGVIYDEFIDIKKAEWQEYHAQVSQWEIDRYLTFF